MTTESKRFEYFRMRTQIGKLEASCMALATTLKHEPFLLRYAKSGTSVGCKNCDAWGCAEIEDGMELAHGDVLTSECGTIMFNVEELRFLKEALGGAE